MMQEFWKILSDISKRYGLIIVEKCYDSANEKVSVLFDNASKEYIFSLFFGGTIKFNILPDAVEVYAYAQELPAVLLFLEKFL